MKESGYWDEHCEVRKLSILYDEISETSKERYLFFFLILQNSLLHVILQLIVKWIVKHIFISFFLCIIQMKWKLMLLFFWASILDYINSYLTYPGINILTD